MMTDVGIDNRLKHILVFLCCFIQNVDSHRSYPQKIHKYLILFEWKILLTTQNLYNELGGSQIVLQTKIAFKGI